MPYSIIPDALPLKSEAGERYPLTPVILVKQSKSGLESQFID